MRGQQFYKGKKPMPIRMEWKDVFFIHWEIDPKIIQSYLPKQMAVDTFQGTAYIGIVPFLMNKVSFSHLPFLFTPFPEINVRTYVKVGEERGIYILNVALNSRLGYILSQYFYKLGYELDELVISKNNNEMLIKSQSFQCTLIQSTGEYYAQKDTIESWLTERFRFYIVKKNGNVLYGDISHDPWILQNATIKIKKNTLFEDIQFPCPNGDPHVLYSKGMSVKGGLLKQVK